MRAQLESFFLAEWQSPSLWQIVLRPLSWLFGAIAALRRALFRAGVFRTVNVGVPVIVVGNISAGGTGKTPLVIALVEMLTREGYKVGVITRGYAPSRVAARTLAPVAHIVTQQKTVTASDEAMMMSQRLRAPVFANRSRVEAARALLKRYPETDVIVSDDGLQHYALARDMEIAVIDGARGVGNGALLPAGPLREAPARLHAVDAIVVNGTPHAGLRADEFGKPVYTMSLGAERFIALKKAATSEEGLDVAAFLAQVRGKHVHAMAGIGNPPRFFAHLERLGIGCAATHAFPDHHPFLPRDFAWPDADMIVMTEKDAVKCRAFADERLWFMRVDALLPPAFADDVLQKLRTVCKRSPSDPSARENS
jgi:tetraacyldisaccharide 4'-kinase